MARDAWSTSFRLDPPAEHAPSRPLVPPGASALAALARPLGLRDPRLLCLVALGLLAVVLARAGPEVRALAPGLALLLPFALGTVFGARSLLPAGAAAAVWALAVHGRGRLAGVLLGAATAIDHSALVAAPLLALADPDGRARSRSVVVAAAAYAICVLPVFALDPAGAGRTYAARLLEGGPGFGLVNLAHYAGPPGLVVVLAAAAASTVVAVLAVRGAIVGRRERAPGLAAALSLLALFVAPAPPVGVAALPLTLLVLAALPMGRRSVEGPSA
jgi:hypothetical protein